MSTASTLLDTPTGQTLQDDHVRIDEMISELASAAEVGADKRTLYEVFHRLDRALSTHLVVEEESLYPRFEDARPAAIASLRQDHADIRALMESVGLQVELGTVRKHVLADLIRRLRAHTAQEDTTVYHWMDRQDDDEGRRVIAQLLMLLRPNAQ